MSKNLILITFIMVLAFTGCQSQTEDAYTDTVSAQSGETSKEFTSEDPSLKVEYIFPHENDEHEGTWLQWPHNNTYEGSSFKSI